MSLILNKEEYLLGLDETKNSAIELLPESYEKQLVLNHCDAMKNLIKEMPDEAYNEFMNPFDFSKQFELIRAKWFTSNFATTINDSIINIMKRSVEDLCLDVNIDDAIVLNPCIKGSFNYNILVSLLGEINTKKYVNSVIKHFKSKYKEEFDSINQKYFKGLMKELD